MPVYRYAKLSKYGDCVGRTASRVRMAILSADATSCRTKASSTYPLLKTMRSTSGNSASESMIARPFASSTRRVAVSPRRLARSAADFAAHTWTHGCAPKLR